jgi:hypothetical protein
VIALEAKDGKPRWKGARLERSACGAGGRR